MHGHEELVLKMAVLESKLIFDALAPARLIVKVNICALFVLVSGELGIIMTLKPREKVFVIAP